ncbi:MAG: serine--tRNA ligase [Dehalococcoidia bacterium]|nr:serine--tRNA ligase [Dehalococcoidia bacterium]MCL0059428.1 serine--tRNA ligase [Dehalococcoidia bacterium]
MVSIQFIRQDHDIVREALARRNDDAPLDEILRLDSEHRKLLQEIEGLRARRNEVSKELGRMKEMLPELIADMRQVGERIKALEQEETRLSEQLTDMLLRIPNIPHPSVPLGRGETDNVVVRSRGEPRRFDFKPRPHWELGEALGIIDFQRGVKLSGSRFYVLKGWGARLQRALIDFMLDLHIKEHGYTEIYPPFMVRRECMVGSGNLPKFADNLYHDQEDDFWFVPTAEVPLTNLYRGEILPPGTLPIYHVAFTTCFRREKMSAGKDTRGIKRGHQFDKVELYKFVEPDESDGELERMVEDAGAVCGKLGLPYRIVQLCTADLGFASAKSYDIEVWAPGCDEWLEVSSCSNCTDFQARRANVRYRPDPGAKPQFVHTLNGSGLALPRVLIAVLESYQQGDGSITVPDPLRPYVGADVIR